MKKNTFFCIIIVLFSCSRNTRFIGKYSSNDNPNSFQFNLDSTFFNEYREGHGVKYSTGKWSKISKNSIILTSKINNINVPLTIRALDSSKTGNINLSIDLQINNGLELSNYYCCVYLNNKVFKIKRADSISSIQMKPPVESLYLAFLKSPKGFFNYIFPVTTEKAKFSKPLSHNIRISVSFNDLFFTYHPFNKDTIIVKKKYIEIFNSYLNRWQNIPKVSDKTNIFVHFQTPSDTI